MEADGTPSHRVEGNAGNVPGRARDIPMVPTLSPEPGRRDIFTIYPDGSRSFDDLVSILSMCTREDSPFVTLRAGYLYHYLEGEARIFFEDGFFPPPHKHNFVELAYIMEGEFHKQIEGRDHTFKEGEFFLLNQDVSHGEYYYRKNLAVVWLRLSNAFFDKSMNHRDVGLAGGRAEDFLRRFIINGNREYCFIRFSPLSGGASSRGGGEAPDLLGQILGELTRPRPGGAHISIGYVKRLLSLLPLDYQISVKWKDRGPDQKYLFEEIRHFLREHCEDVLAGDLMRVFGHNRDYFNRLIKLHTGLTYSAYLQNIRMEKAALLLKTSEYPVAEIAHRVGYENVSYFYKIFTREFRIKPNEMRRVRGGKAESN
jgi:AraC-like DNA-binding protein